ncbi:DUF5133 domain-containing protein [Streptomyces sp. H39-S7]|uniref:DUF5133 domain-containing protein n=1 Tax=Streptomyces sp. H39-S7 TaxID=3004357 RepID=UPI0022AFD20A|nr:DUF5133 domain-containing protein [Streptomyces sp. H39-S7]MCZ4125913.1 DUF5133 domain-containing protein [Streptomyces sp. H39-S7]
MLMAHPAVLRNLLERYDALRLLARSDAVDPSVQRQLQDTVYTLCVSTGTRVIGAALIAAREQTRRGSTAPPPPTAVG